MANWRWPFDQVIDWWKLKHLKSLSTNGGNINLKNQIVETGEWDKNLKRPATDLNNNGTHRELIKIMDNQNRGIMKRKVISCICFLICQIIMIYSKEFQNHIMWERWNQRNPFWILTKRKGWTKWINYTEATKKTR